VRRSSWASRSSCSRRRTRSSTKARIHCPKRSSTASCSRSASATRRATRKRDRRAHGGGPAHRGPARRRSGRHPGRAQRHRRAVHGPESRRLHRRYRPRDPRAAGHRPGGAQAADRVRRLARASIYLAQAARAHAYLRGRAFVVPEDVKAMAFDVLRHRVLLTFEAEAKTWTPTASSRRSWRRWACRDVCGQERRRAVTSPVRARRRPCPPRCSNR